MRSRAEIAFRVSQEFRNAWSFTWPPKLPYSASCSPPAALLPEPEPAVQALRGTPFAAEVERLAESVLRHRFPLFGMTINAGPAIHWRRDYASGRETGTGYSRRIPYLDFARVGDHKVVWEINRHQHLVLLAQAFRLTGRSEFLDEIAAQMESWLEQNPFLRGINWASALEVAFRALSWIWVLHLAGHHMEAGFRRRFVEALWLHGRYLEQNLSVYFSPNTHLLGEAVALHALGALFPGLPGAPIWEAEGARLVREQMDLQVRPDGSHFEQSTYYHVYALDFFLFHALLAPPPAAFRQKMERMAEYLDTLLGPSGLLPCLGDDDGGRLFHPYGPRDRFGLATLAAAAIYFERTDWHYEPEDALPLASWWMGAPALAGTRPHTARNASSRLFPDSGLAVLKEGALQVLVDAGPFGHGGAGHSHSDTLSVVVRHGSTELLIDPGTFTYTAAAEWRDWFRGSAAHNTIRVAGKDQASPVNPFRWNGKPVVERKPWAPGGWLDAACRQGPYLHRRRVMISPDGWLLVLDDIAGPPEPVLLEQFWHAGVPVQQLATHRYQLADATLLLWGEGDCSLQEGWRSPVYGCRLPAPVIQVTRNGPLPARFAALLSVTPLPCTDLAVDETRVMLGDRVLAKI